MLTVLLLKDISINVSQYQGWFSTQIREQVWVSDQLQVERQIDYKLSTSLRAPIVGQVWSAVYLPLHNALS